ncbi:hypothetical protein BLA24_19535 [Streptomyces cinnamoneus]|uniref:WXG100 family type VII secretion target n=1 Tax=Streptomyces cinnamoneus TaxID=53446 RepID=A0A2G1XF20_STRCJ|nr:hypothetical protein [Streptomyces cinnamoneus]PHQ49836.1 hypothetical protein BLA24_19535 [Streptomyces cinnamoneus]PPT13388.1 hypothetical protein CYQ11_11260 [Streptomyces cinnamoneus]
MSTPPPGPVSPLVRQRVSGLFTVSDFESKTHQELRAMVEHAKPYEAGALSDRLNVAAAAIKKVGEDLKAHMAEVEWEGEGGDAFRLWGADMANATLRLSGFSEAAGRWMGHAIATLSDVKSSMPEVSASSRATLDSYLHNNPNQLGSVPSPLVTDQTAGLKQQGPSQQQAYDAQKRLDADQAEAAQLMRKLAQSYAWSAHNISVTERPTFPPIDARMMPPSVKDLDDVRVEPGGGPDDAADAASGRPGMAALAAPEGSGSLRHQPADVQFSPSVAPASIQHPGTTQVDGGVSLAQSPTLMQGIGTAQAQPSDAPTGLPLLPPPGIPPVMPVLQAKGLPGGEGATTGRSGSASRLPDRSVASTPGRGMVGGRVGVSSPVFPNEGIIGGRPVPRETGLPQARVPRGTVIGAEPGQGGGQGQARAAMGHGGGYAGGPGVPANQPGAAGQRRVAHEPGWTAGGRPAAGVGKAGSRAFTPGGSGLLRNRGARPNEPQAQGGGGAQGTMTSRSATPAVQPEREGTGRPGYVVEGDETWTQGGLQVVPPVID